MFTLKHFSDECKVVICEPQCWGFEHAHFNAALLDTVLLAYPSAQVVFMGESEHSGYVRDILQRNDGQVSHRVDWRALSIPLRNLSGLRRLPQEYATTKRILRFAGDAQTQLLVLASVTNAGILAVKLRSYMRQAGLRMLVVTHGMLGSILGRWPRRPWNWPLSLRVVLRLPHPSSLRYIALGDSIYASLAQMQPVIATHFKALDAPYYENEQTFAARDNPVNPEPLRFGFFGVAHGGKDFASFLRLAAEIHDVSRQQAEFHLVGFLANAYQHADVSCISGVSRKPLTPDEYSRRAEGLTYAISFANPEHYRLVVSASFLDALSYGKPGVYLRNPYVEHYFSEMGDVGYLCDTYEEVRNTVYSIINDFPRERYLKQCTNIRNGRKRFLPSNLAPKLKAIVEAI